MPEESSHRRIGAVDSASRARLVQAAATLLVEEGYAAVTSRRVGAKAGLKAQLVHYYFPSMDDLFIEIFRTSAESNLAAFEGAVAADPSLTNLWRLNSDPRQATFYIEFVALARHRKELRAEIARYADRFRAAQLDAMGRALSVAGITAQAMPPAVAMLLLTGVSQILSLEDALGVTGGHRETRAFVDATLSRLEPPPPSAGAT
jgi:AcrR family transcriptional regulator